MDNFMLLYSPFFLQTHHVCDSVFFCELVECSVGQNLLQAFVYFIAELGISFLNPIAYFSEFRCSSRILYPSPRLSS